MNSMGTSKLKRLGSTIQLMMLRRLLINYKELSNRDDGKLKIRIREVMDNYILFTSEFGSGRALWNGNQPALDQEYHVEAEISETLTWLKEVMLNSISESKIVFNNGVITIAGVLESVDEDGFSVIRIGDSIIPVMINGANEYVGRHIKAIVTEITLFDQNY